jgi:hypothetical protein
MLAAFKVAQQLPSDTEGQLRVDADSDDADC